MSQSSRMAESAVALSPKTLPLRRRAQLKRVLAGEPIGQASLAVGYASKSTGSRALSDTRKRLAMAMDHFGLTPESFVRDYLLPLLNATQTQRATFMGTFTDAVVEEDNGIRLAAAKETGKLMGLYPKDDNAGPVRLDININNVAVTNE